MENSNEEKKEEIKVEEEKPTTEKKTENLEQPKEEKAVNNSPKKDNKSIKKLIIIGAVSFVAIVVLLLLIALILGGVKNKESGKTKKADTAKVVYNENTIKGNSLDDFDINFLNLENEEINKVYSPLSIKYALSMLSEGTDGQSYAQIKSIIGDYKYKKYKNSANMSLSNALFVKNEYQETIKDDFVKALKNNYDADVVFDSFQTPDVVNNWVKAKTLNLIDKLFNDLEDYNFVLVNALAIDMEWNKKIQLAYYEKYINENFSASVSPVEFGYPSLKFNNAGNVKATHVKANANRYDIVKELGEDKIRKEVGDAYQAWLDEDMCGNASEQPSVKEYVDKYIEDINTNYNQVNSSTDFYFHTDDEVKVFAKDLKEYDGTTLEYVAIMPKNEKLKDYVKNLDSEKVLKLINGLKEIKLENFKDGVVTDLDGGIPIFKYDYELKLIQDLEALGIKDIFDPKKADLSKLTTDKDAYIGSATHKATIDFSNEGIKAAAVTTMGGMGAAGCEFSYEYDVPVEKIDLMFDKPYLYFIINKDSKEVWFAGEVYQPTLPGDDASGYVLNEMDR